VSLFTYSIRVVTFNFQIVSTTIVTSYNNTIERKFTNIVVRELISLNHLETISYKKNAVVKNDLSSAANHTPQLTSQFITFNAWETFVEMFHVFKSKVSSSSQNVFICSIFTRLLGNLYFSTKYILFFCTKQFLMFFNCDDHLR
jgi:hypothetical protein